MINIHTHYSCHLTYGNTLNRRFILCLYSWVVWVPVASEMYHLHCRLTSVDSMSLCKTPSMCATSTEGVQWCNGRGALLSPRHGFHWISFLQRTRITNTHTRTHLCPAFSMSVASCSAPQEWPRRNWDWRVPNGYHIWLYLFVPGSKIGPDGISE